jgi:hypothetical protein
MVVLGLLLTVLPIINLPLRNVFLGIRIWLENVRETTFRLHRNFGNGLHRIKKIQYLGYVNR